MEKDPEGFEFNNVLGKLPGESDEEWMKRTGQESTPVTTEDVRKMIDHKSTVDGINRLEDEDKEEQS